MGGRSHHLQMHPAALVLHERKSRVTLAARLAGKTAAETISAMLAVFGRIDPHLRRSITFDNDTAFAQHRLLSTMRDMTTWFCDAYASWQKGGVENANGRLRRWLPRHLDIDRTSDQEIQEIVLTTNSRPVNASASRRLSKFARRARKGCANPLLLTPLRFAPESRRHASFISAQRVSPAALAMAYSIMPRGRSVTATATDEG